MTCQAPTPLMMMDKFKAEVDLMFVDLNQEVMAQQKLSSLQQGTNSISELIQQFEIHGPTSRLGDIRLVHHFEQVLNSHLRENIYVMVQPPFMFPLSSLSPFVCTPPHLHHLPTPSDLVCLPSAASAPTPR